MLHALMGRFLATPHNLGVATPLPERNGCGIETKINIRATNLFKVIV